MMRPLILLSLMAALGQTPALAQEATDDTATDGASEAPAEAPATGETGTGGANIGGALDLGQEEAPPGAAQDGPRTFIRDTYDDWQLQCLDVPEGQGEDVCQMYQLLTDENGASVAEVSIFRLQNGGQAVAGGTFVVPLETLLTAKLSVAVDGGQARTYDYSFCAPIGCYARVGFTAEDIARFRAGAIARVTLVPALAPDQRVTVNMSLKGFTAAYNETTSLRQ